MNIKDVEFLQLYDVYYLRTTRRNIVLSVIRFNEKTNQHYVSEETYYGTMELLLNKLKELTVKDNMIKKGFSYCISELTHINNLIKQNDLLSIKLDEDFYKID
jgi:hypothetical protein